MGKRNAQPGGTDEREKIGLVAGRGEVFSGPAVYLEGVIQRLGEIHVILGGFGIPLR